MNLFASLLIAASIALPPAPFVPWPVDKPARELLANFNAGRFDEVSKDFNDEMRVTCTLKVLKDVKAQLDQEAGAFKSVDETRHAKDSGFRVVDLMCTYEKGPVDVRVTFDGYNRIGAISLKRIVDDQIDQKLETAARELQDDLSALRFEAAGKAFDDNMRRQLTPPRLAELSASVTQRYGTFKSVVRVAQRRQNTYQVIDLISAYDKGAVAFSVFFDGAGRIAGVHIEPGRP